MFKASFDSRAVYFLTVGKSSGVVNFNFNGEVVDLLKTFRKPRLKLHMLIEFKERLADTVAERRPAAVTFVRIGTDIFHCHAVSHCAVSKSLRVVR